MQISPQNTVFIYRLNDDDSGHIAIEYQRLHQLHNHQIIGINCSDNEILPNYTTFQSEVENQIKSAISNLTVFCIVLGYNVPGGFKDGSDIISSTSRISRINFPFEKKRINEVYDRRLYKRFDEIDAAKCLVVSRLDGRNKNIVLNQLNKTRRLIKQLFVGGYFYFDPYSNLLGRESQIYSSDLTDFQDNVLPNLDLPTRITTFVDPYVDSFHPFVDKDSFYWGWFTDRGSSNFFQKNSFSRSFFYNADYDGGFTVKSSRPDLWPQLAIENGYVNTAGAMSNPGIDGFLRPTPFFESLLNNSTIGEAYLFSNPYWDWTISFFGDPLVKPTMPDSFDDHGNNLNVDDTWYDTLVDVERMLAYEDFIKIEFTDIINETIATQDIPTVTSLITSLESQTTLIGYQATSLAQTIIKGLEAYALSYNVVVNNDPSLDNYLTTKNFQISQSAANLMNSQISSSNIFPIGFWSAEFPILDETGTFSRYFFELDVSDTEDFSNILFNIDSENDITNWYVEIRQDNYDSIPSGGVFSNFIGMNIRYNSKQSQYLTSGQTYYFRMRQKTIGYDFPYRQYQDVIYS